MNPAAAMEKTNPFVLPHIINQVVSNLGRADLLNARLVNKDWNKECLQFTRTKYRMKLSTDIGSASSCGATGEAGGLGNLVAYEEFCSKTQPTYVMPFHIHLNLDCHSDNVLVPSANSAVDDELEVNIKCLAAVGKSISFLMDTFGIGTTEALKIDYDSCSEVHWNEIVHLLKKCAPGLKLLDFDGLSFYSDIYATAGALRDANISFPRLLVLKCNTNYSPDYGNQRQGPHPPIYRHIINKSPNLRKLVISDDFSNEFGCIPFNTLYILRMEEGDIFEPYHWVCPLRCIESCKQSNPITLKEFSLYRFGAKSHYTKGPEILGYLADSLETLRLHTEPSSATVELIPLPTLQRLKKIQLLRKPNYTIISDKIASFPLFIINSMETFSFRQESLPNLCTVEIDVGNFLATSSPGLFGTEIIRIQNKEIFPNVTTLILVNSDCDWINEQELKKEVTFPRPGTFNCPKVSIDSNFNHFNTIFPNVSRLILKMFDVERDFRNENEPPKGADEIMLEVLFGPYFSQIKELQIEFCDCGNAESAEPLLYTFNEKKRKLGVSTLPATHKFKDLKVLKLIYKPKVFEEIGTMTQIEVGSRALRRTLEQIAQHFRSLWKLEIPRDWIGKTISTRNTRLGYIEKICSDHPHLTIDLVERQDFWKDGDFDEE